MRSGCFALGNQHNYADERPRHRVCVAAFRIQRTEVTVADYQRCQAAGKCTAVQAHDPRHPTRRQCNSGRQGFERHPVNCVTWKQARAYCAWRGMRLPQEAEWERAAFGMRPGAWPRAKQTAPVGTRPQDRSRTDVLDLGGNVSEWTADWFTKAYYKRSPEKQPRGPKSGRAHSVRGCHFRCPKGSRLRRYTTRHYSATWDPTIGFRCARGRRGR